MAHLDLEEQEQLDQIKHFWRQYGKLITGLLTAVLLALAAYNGWQYWQRSQATQAAGMYDAFERVARSGDLTRLGRPLADIQEKFPTQLYSHQAALLAAKLYAEGDKNEAAVAALRWVIDKAKDPGYQSLARLRLAGLQIDGMAFDDALKTLTAPFPASFEPLANDRRGDVEQLLQHTEQAIQAYKLAYQTMDANEPYRRLVEAKLIALGADPQADPSKEAAK